MVIQPSSKTLFKFDVITVDLHGEVCARTPQQISGWVEPLSETVALELVEIPAGEFWMGAPSSEEGWSATQAPPHRVCILKFAIARMPITQAQWAAVAALPKVQLRLEPEPGNWQIADHPVEQISWSEAVEFCDRLTALTQRLYRLPSEAEWEYACRAGTTTPFHFGPTISTDLANYSGIDWEYQGKVCSHGSYGQGKLGSDRRETTPAGSFQAANAFGLLDMHGNVREWCADVWHPDYTDAPTNGSAWLDAGQPNRRVVRGGSWNGGPRACRSAARAYADPERGMYDLGFRVVCEVRD
ncbi:MAG TPA: formylglycine-generating enzyme family protein [Leptolyngbyaceae cyanobacterium M33_DOE_097]|uniref:Formylglycine-generating enzyme family protein n=1 Tax=Oscillatoriales cyanobacterium SpSt-418 TaxID=2282169 RepID=A0A7C3PIL2_9CYAN|nr:formylglycine-generating enzyme family protein [Leptolyngbyaceae cyanobacterium M33_DOE_097]